MLSKSHLRDVCYPVEHGLLYKSHLRDVCYPVEHGLHGLEIVGRDVVGDAIEVHDLDTPQLRVAAVYFAPQ